MKNWRSCQKWVQKRGAIAGLDKEREKKRGVGKRRANPFRAKKKGTELTCPRGGKDHWFERFRCT